MEASRMSVEDYAIFDGEVVYEDYYRQGQRLWGQAIGRMEGRLIRITVDADTSYPRQGHAHADLWSEDDGRWKTIHAVPGELLVYNEPAYKKAAHAWHLVPQFSRMEDVLREILRHRDAS